MIRLLNARTHELPDEAELKRQQGRPYVIISHVWQGTEVTFDDMPNFKILSTSPSGPKYPSAFKITGASSAVLRHSNGATDLLWLDTVCIDKKNLTEFSTAINSMWTWYRRATACFAYLEDVPSPGGTTDLIQSKWFTRGWTLQELVAPRTVIFFDKHWNVLGDKESLQRTLSARTKISPDFLLHRTNISGASLSQRMSWAAGRVTTVPEDIAYCLLGLFGANMPLLYGEGKERALRRLQEEIMRYSDDHSLFAWKSDYSSEPTATAASRSSGLLAESPDCFQETGQYVHKPNKQNNRPFQMTNKGISIDLYLQQYQGVYIASIDCLHGPKHYLGIFLECISGETQQYRRIRTNELCRVVDTARGQLRSIYVKAPDDI